MSPASSLAQRCSVTASLKVLLSSSSLVTEVTMSIRRVIDWTAPSAPPRRSREVAPSVPAVVTGPGAGSVTVTTSRRAPSCSVATPAIRLASNGPAGPSSLHSTRLVFPVLATAASWLCTAARDGRSTNAVSSLPVA